MKIGSHVSISKGLLGSVKEAISYNSSTFMVYTGAPQNTIRKPIAQLLVKEGLDLMKKNNIDEFVVHAPYIINMASYKDRIYELANEFLAIELQRTYDIGSKYLVVHPGSFTDKDLDYGISRIVDVLNNVLDNNLDVCICLETMAGKGTEVGRTFEELGRIIDGVKFKNKIGVCFDTCHVFDSGYDIQNDLDGVMAEFDKFIGLDKLKVFHINGSLNIKGSKKDRHANIGAKEDNPKGLDNIGFETIYNLVHSKYTKNKPLLLETPWISKTKNLYKEEIELLRGE